MQFGCQELNGHRFISEGVSVANPGYKAADLAILREPLRKLLIDGGFGNPP
jgi:hypothetical protein